MKMNVAFVFLAWFTMMPFSLPAAAAGEAVIETAANVSQASSAPLQSCRVSGEQKLDVAQATQTDCCKGHKGVCGCRAGKIVCCDGTASSSCTCHGEDGFTE